MAIDVADLTELADLVAPSHTAVLTMEMQRGVCGDLATMPIIARAVDAAGVVGATASLLNEARSNAVTVVHCTFSLLSDRAGTPMNAPLIEMLARHSDHLLHGAEATEVLAELGTAPTDLYSNRHHGFSPFTGTGLNAVLRSHNVSTVVVTGVSLNLGIPGTVIEAVNLGFQVVVVRDCVVGMPAEYGEALLKNTLSMVSTIATSNQLMQAWA
jgi:nicotinamidase-related amidase